jgi:RNA polymerase sigma-B factor
MPTLVAVPDAPPSDSDLKREAERQAFLRLRRTGDPQVRDQVIEDHLWLARHAARRFAGRGELNDDLLQVASFALIKAVDRFDPAQGTRFATYAMPTMLGELRRHFRDKTWSMRVSRRLKDLHIDVRATREVLTNRLGRTPTVDELAEALDTTPEEILEAMEAGNSYKSASLDQPRSDGTADSGPVPGVEDERLAGTDERIELERALASLPERERNVVFLYYFGELTQAEIAERVGVSQVHVSRILRSSLEELRSVLTDGATVGAIRTA